VGKDLVGDDFVVFKGTISTFVWKDCSSERNQLRLRVARLTFEPGTSN
jgi:hypothetical protein